MGTPDMCGSWACPCVPTLILDAHRGGGEQISSFLFTGEEPFG